VADARIAERGEPALTTALTMGTERDPEGHGSEDYPTVPRRENGRLVASRRSWARTQSVSDRQLAGVLLSPHRFHGEWNYSVSHA